MIDEHITNNIELQREKKRPYTQVMVCFHIFITILAQKPMAIYYRRYVPGVIFVNAVLKRISHLYRRKSKRIKIPVAVQSYGFSEAI